jgi:hypothetical protein
MEKRGRSVVALVLGVAVAVLVSSLVFAASKVPDKDLTIDTQGVYEKKTKSPVVFPHVKHKALKCIDCHHEYKDGKNVWQEGQEVKKCGACHKDKAQEKVLGLKEAFHKQCDGCHKQMKKDKKQTGPTSCTKCHPPKAGEKAADEKEAK